MCDFLFGVVDILAIFLVVLPLYPYPVDGFVYSVNLFSYSEITPMNRMTHWLLFLLLISIGFLKILLAKKKEEKRGKWITGISMGVSIRLL